jgi:hypothetical protein
LGCIAPPPSGWEEEGRIDEGRKGWKERGGWRGKGTGREEEDASSPQFFLLTFLNKCISAELVGDLTSHHRGNAGLGAHAHLSGKMSKTYTQKGKRTVPYRVSYRR